MIKLFLDCDQILKTDRNVALGLFHFIGPTNSYTHTPPTHSGITRFSVLVYISRASFADNVKLQMR